MMITICPIVTRIVILVLRVFEVLSGLDAEQYSKTETYYDANVI